MMDTGIGSVVAERLIAVERLIGSDPGGRGIGPLVTEGQLLSACLALYDDSTRVVGITTGFYIASCGKPETDGPLGALAM